MKGTPAIYLGRIVDKKNFRAFVYGANGEKKLVNSWDAYEAAMESGLWFATVEDAELSKVPVEEVSNAPVAPKAQSKAKPKAKAKVEEVDEPVAMPKGDGMVFEVTDENR